MTGDKLTRWTAVAAVVAVAAVAAVISYRHAVTVVTSHGEPGMVGHLYPAIVDGLIVAASMVLLDAARHQETAPALSVWLLGAGIGATLAANVLAGVSSGLLGAIVAAWPALGFVGCYELLMLLVRASARRRAPAPEVAQGGPWLAASQVHPEPARPLSPHPALEGALAAPGERTSHRSSAAFGKQPGPVTPERVAEFYAADLAQGRVPSARQIKREWPVGTGRATELHDHLEAALATT